MDAVVGCISDLRFEQIAPWVVSLDACGFRGRRVVIHFRVDSQTVAELNQRGYETYDASCLHNTGNRILKKNSGNDEISVNRFYYIWHFLSQSAVRPYPRYLMAMDVSDVIFQRNPSLWLEQNLGQKRLVVGCESLCFENEPWAAQTMQECYGPHVWEAYRRKLIYNAGTIAGEFQTMIDLCLQVYLLSPGDRVLYSDQLALNLLLGLAVYREITCFASSEDGWACQAGTTVDPNLLQEVRHHLTCPAPSFDGEFVRTAAGEIFTLVHQYNRVQEWDLELKKKYRVVTTRVNPIVEKSWWRRRLVRGKRI
ncbi:MAG: hypothetical protein ACXVKH_12995 [Candidatus Angelobacter sp.]